MKRLAAQVDITSMCYKCGGVFESAELAQHMELCARSALVRCDNCQSKIRMADRAEHDKGCQTLTHCESCGELVRTLEFENHTFFCQKHEFTPFTKNQNMLRHDTGTKQQCTIIAIENLQLKKSQMHEIFEQQQQEEQQQQQLDQKQVSGSAEVEEAQELFRECLHNENSNSSQALPEAELLFSQEFLLLQQGNHHQPEERDFNIYEDLSNYNVQEKDVQHPDKNSAREAQHSVLQSQYYYTATQTCGEESPLAEHNLWTKQVPAVQRQQSSAIKGGRGQGVLGVLACSSVSAYTSLSAVAWIKKTKQSIEHLSKEVCQIPSGRVVYLLHKALWDESAAVTETLPQLTDELFFEPLTVGSTPDDCPICLSPMTNNDSYSLYCAHRACKSCWRSYVKANIQLHGCQAIFKTCIVEGCLERVDESTFDLFDQQQYQQQDDDSNNNNNVLSLYEKFLLKNAEMSHLVAKGVICCPNAHCDSVLQWRQSATQLRRGAPVENLHCARCDQYFCNVCRQEAHRPAHCTLLAAWNELSRKDDLTAVWTHLNTKQCPKCRQTIEKNDGCLHIKCKCGHDFCWNCLAPFEIGRTHALFYTCTERGRQSTDSSDQPMGREKFQLHQHCQMQFVTLNQTARVLRQQKAQRIARLREYLQYTEEQGDLNKYSLDFFTHAIDLVIEARMAVKYTFLYDYYARDEANSSKKELFQFVRAELLHKAELLDKLTNATPHLVKHFMKAHSEQRQEEFNKYKSHVSRLSDALEKYFNKNIAFFESEMNVATANAIEDQ